MFDKRLTIVCAATALAMVLLAGCEQAQEPLRVGSKDFTENQILGQMMASLAAAEGIPVRREIPYGSSSETFEALRQGRIDLYAEYVGTGLVHLGQPPSTDADPAYATVKKLYAPLGIDWRERFGFSNDYVLVMRPAQARALGIDKISDLAKLADGVRFAVDGPFSERPLDGLGALERRYGLKQRGLLVYASTTEGKARIVQALLDDKADVAELYRTDSQIPQYGLVRLKDDVDFFPLYQAAPLVRHEALARYPALAAALVKLGGKIDADTMAQLNAQVDFEGQSPRQVADAFLVKQGLIKVAPASAAAEELKVAVEPADALSGPVGRALAAARSVFPQFAVTVVRDADPLADVANGTTRLAVASADDFFVIDKGRAVRHTDAEAVGVVGYKLAHVVARTDGPSQFADIKTLGVAADDGTGQRVAKMLLLGLGLADQVQLKPVAVANPSQRAAALESGSVDALFMMAPAGDQAIAELLQSGGYRLLGLGDWSHSDGPLRFTVLRPAKLAAGSYPGQNAAVETISVQLVMAGPTSQAELGARGPGTTGVSPTQPIPDETIKKLRTALGTSERVDPALPVAAALRPALKPEAQRMTIDFGTLAPNVLVIAFLIFLLYLLTAKGKPEKRRARGAGGESS